MKTIISYLGLIALLFCVQQPAKSAEAVSDDDIEYVGETSSQVFRSMNDRRRLFANRIAKQTSDLESLRSSLSLLLSEDELSAQLQSLDGMKTANDASKKRYTDEKESIETRIAELVQSGVRSGEELDNLNARLSLIDEELRYFGDDNYYAQQKNLLETNLANRADYEKQIAVLIDEIPRDQDNLLDIENDIADLLASEEFNNTFKVYNSVFFLALVSIVIIGFYVIAFKKESIAINIFSGEKGIQFITLFLIVIAIILFGIMGTLESRELSALLGALSGYILGKTSSAPQELPRLQQQ